MKNLLFGGVATLTALLAVGCSGDRRSAATGTSSAEPAASEHAYVRFVNADSGEPNLDLYFGDTKTFTNVAFKDVTNYQEVPAERHDFILRAPGSAQDLATNSEGLWGGRYYTVVAVHTEDGTASIETINDDLSPPANGKAKVRLFNAAPDVGQIELASAGQKDQLVDDVDFKSSGDFKEVTPVAGPIEVRREDKKGTATQVAGLYLQPGRMYTVIVTGNQGRLEAIRIDEAGGMQARR